MSNLADQIHIWASWRLALRRRTFEFARWLESEGLMDASAASRVDRILAGIDEEKLRIAIVGEVSRGKSEILNAIFAQCHGHRLLPAFPGRSTMCPTELHWNPADAQSIRLLPIETRLEEKSLREASRRAEEWVTVPLDAGDERNFEKALEKLTETKRVTAEEARRYLHVIGSDGSKEDGFVEVPRWRHAIVNFPHPLLASGMTILDTPGLNAIGNEPELTINLIPDAHVVLFILSVDTGVTQSDLEAWRAYVACRSEQRLRCLVVLNKVDMLWGGLRCESEIAEHVAKQLAYVSQTLKVDRRDVIPLSALQGFMASVTGDAQLAARSGLSGLQDALTERLIPHRRAILRQAVQTEFASLIASTRALLEARGADLATRLEDLRQLRASRCQHRDTMVLLAGLDRNAFGRALKRFQSYRSRFSRLSNELFESIGMRALEAEARKAFDEMKGCMFSPALLQAMRSYFAVVEAKLTTAETVVHEILSLAEEIYASCQVDLGVSLTNPRGLSLRRRRRELVRIEAQFRQEFDRVSTMLTEEQLSLIRRFFKTVASEVKWIYRLANSDATHWLDSIISPVERQIRQKQADLREHLQAVRRLQERTAGVDELLAEVEADGRRLAMQLEALRRMGQGCAPG